MKRKKEFYSIVLIITAVAFLSTVFLPLAFYMGLSEPLGSHNPRTNEITIYLNETDPRYEPVLLHERVHRKVNEKLSNAVPYGWMLLGMPHVVGVAFYTTGLISRDQKWVLGGGFTTVVGLYVIKEGLPTYLTWVEYGYVGAWVENLSISLILLAASYLSMKKLNDLQ